MKKIFVFILALTIIAIMLTNCIYATNNVTTPGWWTEAFNWTPSGNGNGTLTTEVESITNLIKGVGNIIFFATTVILGVKYIWGGVESKASIKDSLITLVVAALFFYGYTTITSLFNVKGLVVQNNVGTSVKNIYNIVLYVCNVLAIGGVVFIGVKYMLAGAAGKAELKTKSIPVILGIIMVYSTLTFLTLITSLI